MPVTEQDYRAILARMRVDPLFRAIIINMVRENMEVIAADLMREIDRKIAQATQDRRRYF